MELSVNQLVSEVKKAVIGKGLSYGMAEDIAAATHYLCGYHIVADAEIAAFLQSETHSHPSFTFDKTKRTIKLSATATLPSLIAAMDYLIAGQADEIEMEMPHYPFLSLGLIGIRQSSHFGSFGIVANGDDGQPNIAEYLSEKTAPKASSYFIVKHPFHPEKRPSFPARITVDKNAYEVIGSFAFRNYVPSSQASRLAGAGAGLNDND